MKSLKKKKDRRVEPSVDSNCEQGKTQAAGELRFWRRGEEADLWFLLALQGNGENAEKEPSHADGYLSA